MVQTMEARSECAAPRTRLIDPTNALAMGGLGNMVYGRSYRIPCRRRKRASWKIKFRAVPQRDFATVTNAELDTDGSSSSGH